jgi:hypothetical protein
MELYHMDVDQAMRTRYADDRKPSISAIKMPSLLQRVQQIMMGTTAPTTPVNVAHGNQETEVREFFPVTFRTVVEGIWSPIITIQPSHPIVSVMTRTISEGR